MSINIATIKDQIILKVLSQELGTPLAAAKGYAEPPQLHFDSLDGIGEFVRQLPSIPEKPSYELAELMPYHGSDFVHVCYRALLERNPDQAGMEHYVAALESGQSRKLDVIRQLLASPEGIRLGKQVIGLALERRREQFYARPWLRWLLFFMGGKPLSATMPTEMPSRVRHLEDSLREVSEQLRRLKQSQIENMPRIAASIPRPDLTPIESTLNELRDALGSVDQRLSTNAGEISKIWQFDAENRSRLETLENSVADTDALREEISKRAQDAAAMLEKRQEERFTNLADRVSSVDQRFSSIADRVSVHRKDMEQWLTALGTRIDDNQASIRSHRGDMDQWLTALGTRIDDGQASLRTHRGDMDQWLSALGKRIDDNQRVITNQRGDFDQWLTALGKRIDDTQQIINGQRGDLEQWLEALGKRVDDVNTRAVQRESDSQQWLTAIGTRIDDLGSRMGQQRLDMDSWLTAIGNRIDDNARRFEDVNKWLEAIGSRIDDMGLRFTDSKNWLEALGQRLDENGERFSDNNKRFEDMSRWLDALGRRLDEYSPKFTDLSHRIDDKVAGAGALEARLQSGLGRLDEQMQSIQDRQFEFEKIRVRFEEMQRSAALVEERVSDMKERVSAIVGVEDPEADAFYTAFQKRFVAPEAVLEAAEIYAPDIKNATLEAKVKDGEFFLDIGCGMGELLEVLRRDNVPARGIDLNNSSLDQARRKGLDVMRADALEYLEELPDESLLGAAMIQVIEHLDFAYSRRLIDTMARKVKRNGIVIIETVNPYSLVSFSRFWLDWTHNIPMTPELTQFMVEFSGFRKVETRFIREINKKSKLAHQRFSGEKLADVVYGHSDYAVVGRK